MVVVYGPLPDIAESGGAYCAAIPVTCQRTATLSPSASDTARTRSVTPLVALMYTGVGPHGDAGSMDMSACAGGAGAWLKFTDSFCEPMTNFFHRLPVPSPLPAESAADSATV